MQIYYFAWVRERIGLAEESFALTANICTVADLAAALITLSAGHQAALGDLKRLRVAVNQVHVALDHPLNERDEVAFFPPVTGG